jgi:hypothetical protein
MSDSPILQGEREAWLAKAATLLDPLFAEHDEALLRVRVTCGWPSQNARPSKRQRLGECWSGMAAEDGIPQIFITPMVGDSVRVLDILVHELVHTVVGTEVGHKGAFARLARELGLEGKPTATIAGAALKERLNALVAELGPYPHAVLKMQEKPKQSTRLIKAECPDRGCVIRITQKWIDAAEEHDGLLHCPIDPEHVLEVAA